MKATREYESLHEKCPIGSVVQYHAKHARYILSDFYNHLVLLETSLGKKHFMMKYQNFDQRNRVKNYEQTDYQKNEETRRILLRLYNKRFYDFELEKEDKEKLVVERQRRKMDVNKMFNKRNRYLCISSQL